MDHLCGLRLAEDDICGLMKLSWETLTRRIHEKFQCSFADYRTKKMGKTKARLAEKAIEMAMAGSVPMLIFCLKNFNGWSDKTEISFDRLPEPFIIKNSDGSSESMGLKQGGGKVIPIKQEEEK